MFIGYFEKFVLLEIVIITLGLLLLALRFIKLQVMKLMVVFITLSYFFYSGYGIAFQYVDNKYILQYTVFLICMLIPFVLFGHDINSKYDHFDIFIEKNLRLLDFLSVVYFICLFIPLIYPRFKLFDIFYSGFNGLIGFYDTRNEYKSNALIGLIDAIKMFVCPFFIINLTQIQIKRKTKIALRLLLLSILFSFMRYGYLSRYQMVLYSLIILFFAFSIKGYQLCLTRKQIVAFTTTAILSVPFLYAFTFIRIGESVKTGLSFMDSMSLLLEGEVYYPIYYDHIITSPDLASQTSMRFILWLLFLPVPSFLWPGKPRISPDAFTYSLTGKHMSDAGYASSLPSLLGESFMFFGDQYYWIEAFIIGCVMVLIIRYLCKHKTMTFYTVYLIVFSLTLGRGGASSYMSTLINGVVPLVVLDLVLLYNKNR